jgi:hypothetical protein
MGMTRKKVCAGLGAGLLVAALAAAGGWFFFRDSGSAGAANRFQVRAARRAFDGAPPVIPHPALGGACTNCHSTSARELPGVGIAPPNPHLHTPGLGAGSRCEQCHVWQKTAEVFVASTFQGLRQAPRRGDRLFAHAPPVMPHHLFLREDCLACHAGPAARQEILCTHPERARCQQCHAGALPGEGLWKTFP